MVATPQAESASVSLQNGGLLMLEPVRVPDTTERDSKPDSFGCNRDFRPGKLAASLVSYDPGLPARLDAHEPDTQCDCACYAVEAEFLPRLQSPVSFYLELTADCNSHCSSCGNVFSGPSFRQSTFGAPPPLAEGQWAQVLHKLQPLAYNLRLTGGEPTLHPQFKQITATASDMEIPFTVFTNALWDSPQRLCTHLGNLAAFQGLLVSLHGPTPNTHDAFTGKSGSFIQSLANIHTALRAGLHTSISCVITRHNWNLIEDMVETADEICASSLVFNRLLDPNNGELVPSREELRSAIRTIQDLRNSGRAVKLGNCLPACFVPTEQAGCLAGLAFFTVDPWGKVRPCNHASAVCGDLLHQTVEDVWQSPAFEQWRNAYPEQCGTCLAFSSCRGGCRAQGVNMSHNADPLITRPLKTRSVPKSPDIALYEHARPKGVFARRQEEFGTLLLSQNRLYPVSRTMQRTLESLDGNTTLRQIQANHGQPGLNLVASLYSAGMIELQIP